MTDLKALECMLRIRCFEETVEQLFREGRIRGTAHTAIGQEAVAVGACAGLADGDLLTSTHRGHAHLIARGGDPRRMMAELFGRATGYSRGRGGSQMMADRTLGFMGGNGITGGALPLAAGLALHAQLRNTHAVTVCFFGDGAANQGTFHETLNLSALWGLPVVFICENNGYAMSMPVALGTAGGAIAPRAAAYGIPGITVDGNDLHAVRDAAAEAVSRARRGNGPTLMECRTYRLSGHSRGDPRVYRRREEEAEAREREPIGRLLRLMRQHGRLDDEREKAMRARIETEIETCVRQAEADPPPAAATLTEGVWA